MKLLFFILICSIAMPLSLFAEDEPPASLELDDVEIMAPQTNRALVPANPDALLAAPQADDELLQGDDALLPPPQANHSSDGSGLNHLGIDDPSLLLDVEQLPLLPEKGNFGTLKPQEITKEGAPSLGTQIIPPPGATSTQHSKPPPEVFAVPHFVGPLPQKDAEAVKNGVVVKPVPAAQPAVGPRALASLSPMEASLKKPVPLSTPMMPLPGVPDVSVILANGQFYPSKIRLKGGVQTRLLFTTTGKKAAALMIEKLQIQRWIAREEEKPPKENLERAKWEASREVLPNKITEIVLEPMIGTYSFHDAVTGASGEIIVE